MWNSWNFSIFQKKLKTQNFGEIWKFAAATFSSAILAISKLIRFWSNTPIDICDFRVPFSAPAVRSGEERFGVFKNWPCREVLPQKRLRFASSQTCQKWWGGVQNFGSGSNPPKHAVFSQNPPDICDFGTRFRAPRAKGSAILAGWWWVGGGRFWVPAVTALWQRAIFWNPEKMPTKKYADFSQNSLISAMLESDFWEIADFWDFFQKKKFECEKDY